MDFAADAYERDMLAFRAAREARYRSEAGWLTLVERIPLEPGANQTPLGTVTVGEHGHIVLDVKPGLELARSAAGAGAGQRVSGRVEAQVPGPGAPGEPVVFASAGRRFEIVPRGDHLVMRVRDPAAPARIAFTGIPVYPIDAAYRVVAEFARLAAPEDTAVEMSDGDEDVAHLLGVATFALPEAASRLELQIFTEESTGRLYVPFRDRTSREETYGGGRFLYGQEDGRSLVLDFNRACNPPCAFNPLVTCPLPPPANRLDVPVRAGERLPRGN